MKITGFLIQEEASSEAPELPNFITLISQKLGHWGTYLHHWENIIYSWLVIAFLGFLTYRGTRKVNVIPNKLQNFVEMVVAGLDNFLVGVLGKEGRKHVPFLGTLFLYILCMNLIGLVPGMKSPSSSLNTTAALAIIVFLYVQYLGVRNLGVWGYLDHFAGNPRDITTILLVPIMFPIHIIGELARPLTLALRLFGNITGKEILIAAFVILGISIVNLPEVPIGIPLQVPFLFLAILLSLIQALVFTLLSTAYIILVTPENHH